MVSPRYKEGSIVFITYIKFTRNAIPDVISIMRASTSKLLLIIRSTANHTRIAVMNQIIRTEAKAPITSARYQPNDILQITIKKKKKQKKSRKEITI